MLLHDITHKILWKLPVSNWDISLMKKAFQKEPPERSLHLLLMLLASVNYSANL